MLDSTFQTTKGIMLAGILAAFLMIRIFFEAGTETFGKEFQLSHKLIWDAHSLSSTKQI